jgi:hypothetical protein
MKVAGFILTLVLSFAGLPDLYAQEFPSELWHKGFLVTTDKDTLRGELKYDLENNMVQVNSNNALKAIGSRKIYYFEIFDKTVSSYRHFYVLPYTLDSQYETPVIFELLYEGQMSLLAREEIVLENVSATPYGFMGGAGFSRYRLVYRFFFVDTKGNITRYNMKKKELLSIFVRKEKQIKQFIQRNKLDTDNIRDLIRITAYYNSLFDA